LKGNKMKRIMLSLLTIAAVAVMATGATSAYFSDSEVVAGNTFSTGTVSFGELGGMKINLSGMVPGVAQTKVVGFEYTGSTNADVWVGARGTSEPGQPQFFADVVDVTIADYNTGQVYYSGLVAGLGNDWNWVASNTGAGMKYYNATFTMHTDAGDKYQNQTNWDTEFLLYAVQTGAPKPASVPYKTAGYNFLENIY
jgi:predicted ribosomally synthesized peptide with SipW-like signal peptide